MDKTSGKQADKSGEHTNEKLVSESHGAPAADQSINQYWANLTHNLALQSLVGKGVLPDTQLALPGSPKGDTPVQARPPSIAGPQAEQGKPHVVVAKPPSVESKPGVVSANPVDVPAKSTASAPTDNVVPAVAARPDAIAAKPLDAPPKAITAEGKPEAAQGRPDSARPKPHDSVEHTPAVTRALYNLDHRTSDAKTPDAMVVIPPNFDKNKPINLMIYNHGWFDTASSSLKHAQLEEQMKNAPPNTVLIVPEWQNKPGSSGRGASNEGSFGNENFVSAMVQDVFNNTPELKGKSLGDVNHVGIISHSAGYVPTESELYKNPELAKKVNSVTMLDSLYDGHGLDKWIHENIAGLSAGTKHYQNIFNTSTAGNSEAQAQFVANELRKYNGGRSGASELLDHSGTMLTADQIRKYPVIFKSTYMAHMEIPKNYVAIAEEAAERT